MTSAGEPPEPRRRRRELSEEERALWRGIARSVRPLRRPARRDAQEPEPETVAAPAGTPHKAKGTKGTKGTKPVKAVEPARAAKPSAPPPLAALARREKQQIARGRTAIDARIDLHGMTQARAHAALVGFLRRAQNEGARFVLVVTGKGSRTADGAGERGVLRRQVPLWLQLPELRDAVVGFEAAHVAHGGEGALYVRLRRTRGDR
jgi:DNA-nicking Smr family endonuclease